KIFLEQDRVTGSYPFSLQIVCYIFFVLVNGERQPAFTKAKFFDDLSLFAFFIQNVLSHDANIGHSIFYILRNIVIAQEENLQWEIITLCFQLVFYIAQVNPA